MLLKTKRIHLTSNLRFSVGFDVEKQPSLGFQTEHLSRSGRNMDDFLSLSKDLVEVFEGTKQNSVLLNFDCISVAFV